MAYTMKSGPVKTGSAGQALPQADTFAGESCLSGKGRGTSKTKTFVCSWDTTVAAWPKASGVYRALKIHILFNPVQ